MTEVPNIVLNCLLFIDLMELEKTHLFKTMNNLLYISFIANRTPLVYLIWYYTIVHMQNGNFWELDLPVKVFWISCCAVLDVLNIIWAIECGKGKFLVTANISTLYTSYKLPFCCLKISKQNTTEKKGENILNCSRKT